MGLKLDFEHGAVVVGGGQSAEMLDALEDGFEGIAADRGVFEAIVSEEFAAHVFGLGDSVGDQQDARAGLDEDAVAAEFGFFDQADRQVGRVEVTNAGGRTKQRVDVAAVDIVEHSTAAQLQDHHRVRRRLADVFGADA